MKEAPVLFHSAETSLFITDDMRPCPHSHGEPHRREGLGCFALLFQLLLFCLIIIFSMNVEPGKAIVCFKSPASVCFRNSSFHHSRGWAGVGGDKDI